MRLYPAIDIKNGQCVRLRKGVFEDVTVYSERPWEMAALWESMGARFLHLVDLDGAQAGHSVNEEVIGRIVRTVHIPTEIGGGIRSREAAERMLSLGVCRVIVGTKAVSSPEFLAQLIRAFGEEAVVAGVDAKDGWVATDGWEKTSGVKASDLCLAMKEMGVKHIVYTDISRDGMLTGPNVAATKALTQLTGLDVIASGGVSSMDDLHRLNEAGIRGAVIGKALYEKKINLKEAVKCFEA